MINNEDYFKKHKTILLDVFHDDVSLVRKKIIQESTYRKKYYQKYHIYPNKLHPCAIVLSDLTILCKENFNHAEDYECTYDSLDDYYPDDTLTWYNKTCKKKYVKKRGT